MPFGELLQPVLEVVVEVLVRSVGYFLVKWGFYFGHVDPNPDGVPVLLAGFAFWGFVIFGGIHAYFALHT